MIVAMAALVSVQSAWADPLSGTLGKIKDSGVITVAYRDAAIPFSYLADASGMPVGYSQDIQSVVIDEIKNELHMPELKVQYNLVTSQTRLPLIQNGTVDLECGSTTNNVERQQQVAFSVGIFEISTRMLTAAHSGYHEFADLRGKNVVTTAGTTAEKLLRSMNAEQQMGLNVISAKDHGESFQTLESGRAVAFVQDDALLAGERAKARNPEKWVITAAPLSNEIYGCMLRKGDPQFKQLVDTAIKHLFASDRIAPLYAKWFEQPIAPKGLSLNYPMPEVVKSLYAHPTDAPVQPLVN